MIFVDAWIVPIPCTLNFIKRKNEEVVFDRIKQPHENAKTIAK